MVFSPWLLLGTSAAMLGASLLGGPACGDEGGKDEVCSEAACLTASCTAESWGGLAGEPETVEFDAVEGTDYYVVVDGFLGDEGTFDIAMDCAPGP